jgi:diguanylate cyclase (GGDEF)-like protein
VLGRLGGEEFAILLPETDPAAALAAAERFRLAIAERPIELADGGLLRITASFGVAGLEPGFVTAEEWIAAADAPLYAAKRGGRNCCKAALIRPGPVRLNA